MGTTRKTDHNQMYKLWKYKLLRQLPGRWGHYYQRKYERKWLRLQARLDFDEAMRSCEGMTCIDLGANIGEFTRKMALRAKQVIAFEPDPWAHAELQANVADLNNVKVVKAAAGTCEKKVLLHRHAQFEDNPVRYSESSSVIASKSNVTEQGAVEIRQIDFIGYLENLDEDIGVLKIDIEGAEVDLLESLFDRSDILGRIDHIFAETHENRIPGHKARVNALRERVQTIRRPRVNLYWH